MTGPPDTLAGSRLARLAQRRTAAEEAEPPGPRYETCELCSAPIAAEHRHMLDLTSRELMCACQACTILFNRGAAGGGHYTLIPDRRMRLEGFEMNDLAWENLRLPVDMAFFFRNTAEERVVAYYPSPMGPTESQLHLDTWREIEAANPILQTMEPDVEALLVNRSKGARAQWLVPIDECYALVGTIRTRWRGLSGGKEVWEEIDTFFADLDQRSSAPEAAPESIQANAAPPGAAGGSQV